MFATKQLLAISLCSLLSLPAVPAQTTRQQETQSAATIAQDVTIIIQQEKVRFTAQKAVQEMRLQVFDQTGELIYDSGPLTEPELTWTLRNASGAGVKSGLYAYKLLLREAGADAPRERKGHFIVDRASEQDGKTDRLWVTSRNDSEIGTELTVARDEQDTIAGTRMPGRSGEDSTRDLANRRVTEKGAIEKDAIAQENAVVAAVGTAGQIARFNSATDLGNSVMTELNGNIGVGTTVPGARLHIAGNADVTGTVWFQPDASKGGNNSHVHWGATGDWYVRSASANGKVVMQDTGGNVAIGTSSPTSSRLTIEGQNALTARGYEPFLNLQDSNDALFQSGHRIQSAHGDLNFFHGYYQTGSGGIFSTRQYVYIPRMVIKDSGNVGIGNIAPRHQLSLGRGPTWTKNGWGGAMELENASAIAWKANAAGNRFGIGQTNTGLYFFRTASDPGTTGAPAVYDMSISDAGVVSVRTLQITGGSDFAENFDVSVPEAAGKTETAQVEPGMVVSIDPARPGSLMLTTQAYDQRVAGIISGAGGVRPGMTMSQEGTLAHGKHPVALNGRVYCYVDATQGTVEPGDLLTTSDTPGHAMKVTDPAQAQGAIIGKAMTGLKEGRGLVLVLVTLQ